MCEIHKKINTGIFSTDNHTEIQENDIVKISGTMQPMKMLSGWDYGGDWSFTGIVRKNAKDKWRIDPNIDGIINQHWCVLEQPEGRDELRIIKILDGRIR